MLNFFFYYAFCKQVYDFKGRSTPFVLFLEPLDVIEIKQERNDFVYLNWEQYPDLYLEVDGISSNEDIKTFGPFKNNDNLAAIQFQTKNFTLRFINEGLNQCKIGISYLSPYDVGQMHFLADSLFTSPFYYLYNDQNDKIEILIGVLGGAFGMIFLLQLIFGFSKKCS